MKKSKPVTTTTTKREKPLKLDMSFQEAMRRIVRVPTLPTPKK
jgi:hypothetical protein